MENVMRNKSTRKSLRRLLFWSHLVCGLAVGLVILLLSVTGAMLAFKRPFMNYLDHQQAGVIQPLKTRVAIANLMPLAEKNAHQPITSITLSSTPSDPLIFEAGRNSVFLADPYRGTVTGPASPKIRAFFHTVLTVHRWFALADASHSAVEQIIGWCALVFSFLILSGFYLWLPPLWKWTMLRVRLRPGWAANPRARDWNWHHTFGLWLGVPLLAIALTGVIMALPWANALLFRMTGSPLPASHHGPERAEDGHRTKGHGATGKPFTNMPGGKHKDDAQETKAKPHEGNTQPGMNPDLIFASASIQPEAWKSLQLRVAASGVQEYTVTMDRGNGAQPQRRDTLIFDSSGHLLRRESFAQQSLGSRLRALARFLHTGELFGLMGESVAFFACLGGILLVWTGYALSWRRFLGRSPKPNATHI